MVSGLLKEVQFTTKSKINEIGKEIKAFKKTQSEERTCLFESL